MEGQVHGEKTEFKLKVLFMESSKHKDFGVIVEATNREEAIISVVKAMGDDKLREMFTIANHNAPGILGYDVEYITIDKIAELK